MEKLETLTDFYKDKLARSPQGLNQDHEHFNVFEHDDCRDTATVPYARREYFKVALLRGHYIFHYGHKSLEVNGSTLLFFNPDVPYTFEAPTGRPKGYFCIFRADYFNAYYRQDVRDLPMFAPSSKPAYLLTPPQDEAVGELFQRMQQELASDYAYKHDLVRNCLVEVIHVALRSEPTETLYQRIDANVRIASVFKELLDRQFPIEPPYQRFSLRSAHDFAQRLNVHINHLNRALKLTTGKTTTELIAQRLASEAKVLLKHTDWSVSEIAFCLGFEDTPHFDHFFKKLAGQSPSGFRKSAVETPVKVL